MNIKTKKPGVYKIICLSNNKIYIGSSINLYARIKRHVNDLKKQKHPSKHLQNAFNIYGIENFVAEIIEEFETISRNDLLLVEQKYLDEYKPYDRNIGFNTCINAKSPNQNKLSDETKRKISESNKGRIVSEETRKNISLGRRGKSNNPESIEKMRLTKTGVKQSEETIEKRAREYSFIDENGVIYQGKNLKRFCDKYNLHRQNMRMVLKGKRKSHHGFKKF